MVRYSSTAFRRVVIAHLLATAKREYAIGPGPLLRRFGSCRDCDDQEPRRSRPTMPPGATSRWRARVETDAHPLQVQQCRRAQVDVSQPTQSHTGSKSHGRELEHARTRDGLCWSADRAAGKRRWPFRHRSATVNHFGGHSFLAHSTVLLSSRCHRVREMPLRPSAILTVPTEAGSRNRASLRPYAA